MTTQRRKSFSIFMTWLLVLLIALPPWAFAQETDTGATKNFKQEELDQMLAPIALYPDSLLAQVLMASTYPLEVVQADRWAQQNKELGGDVLAAELEMQEWDPSVKSLVQFPDVLAMMGEKLDWTQKLGDALFFNLTHKLDQFSGGRSFFFIKLSKLSTLTLFPWLQF